MEISRPGRSVEPAGFLNFRKGREVDTDMIRKPRYKNLKAVAFDLDGTIYLGNSIIAGAADVIDALRTDGLQIFYFTNASTRTRLQVLAKLTAMGLEVSIGQIYTSAYACAVYAEANGLKNVHCIGTDGLKAELQAMGINVTDNKDLVQGVVVGLEPGFNYDMLAGLSGFNYGTCQLIACNRDRNFPVEGNQLMPGCGPIVAAVEEFLERRVDYAVGKPETFMMELLASDKGLRNDEIVVVGDSYASDIEMAKRYGCLSVLIAKNMKSPVNDTIVIDNIAELPGILFDKP